MRQPTVIDGVVDIRVIPESRAALVEAKETNAMAAMDRPDSAILIIDIGSSTTDYTYVWNLRASPFDEGSLELGCSKIDEMLARSAIASEEEEGKIDSGSLQFFDDSLDNDQNRLAEILYECRMQKEKFFSKDKNYWEKSGKKAMRPSLIAFGLDKQELRLQLSFGQFQAALDQPIKSLKDKNWKDAYKEELQILYDKIQKKNQKNAGEYPLPDVILLVGGGARMPFVEDITKSIFKDADVLFDPVCQFYVSRGLARCGAIDDSVGDFLIDIVGIINSERLENILNEGIPDTSQQLAERFFAIFEEKAVAGYNSWRNGRIATIKDLENNIRSEFDKQREYDSEIQSIVNKWSSSIQEEISALAKKCVWIIHCQLRKYLT